MEKELEKSQQTPVLLTGIDTPSVFWGTKIVKLQPLFVGSDIKKN